MIFEELWREKGVDGLHLTSILAAFILGLVVAHVPQMVSYLKQTLNWHSFQGNDGIKTDAERKKRRLRMRAISPNYASPDMSSQENLNNMTHVSVHDQRNHHNEYSESLEQARKGADTITYAELSEWTAAAKDIIVEIALAKGKRSSTAISHDGFAYSQLRWVLLQSSDAFSLWKGESDILASPQLGILFRSSGAISSPPRDVLQWLLKENRSTGIEGIITSQRVLTTGPPSSSSSSSSAMSNTIVRHVLCEPFSLTSHKRDFVIITSWGELDGGSYFVATRSIPMQAAYKLRPKSRKRVRGKVYCSGFVMRPMRLDDGSDGCELTHVVHATMGTAPTTKISRHAAGRPSKFEEQRTREIQVYMSSLTMNKLQAQISVPHGEELRSGGSSAQENNTTSSKGNSNVGNTSDSANSRSSKHWNPDWVPVPVSAPPSSPPATDAGAASSIANDSGLAPEQAHNINFAAKHARDTLRACHARPEMHWQKLFSSQGITISELCPPESGDAAAGTGLLRAMCSVHAHPSHVRRLVVEEPASLDRLLENRMVLAQVTRETAVQWLGYSAIWPVGACDLLVVTSEESMLPSKPGCEKVPEGDTGIDTSGFLLVSKSIDDICEDVDEVDSVDDDHDDDDDEEFISAYQGHDKAYFSPVPMSSSDCHGTSPSPIASEYYGGKGRKTPLASTRKPNSAQFRSEASDPLGEAADVGLERDNLTANTTTSTRSPFTTSRGDRADCVNGNKKADANRQSEGHRLRLDSALSERLDELIAAEGRASGESRSVDARARQSSTNNSNRTNNISNNSSSSSSSSSRKKYRRSDLRMAGYVGLPSASIPGGTDVYLYVDIDIYNFIPDWLFKVLAQYGLSEMMSRIRTISAGVSSSSAKRIDQGLVSSCAAVPSAKSMAAAMKAEADELDAGQDGTDNAEAIVEHTKDERDGEGERAVRKFQCYLGAPVVAANATETENDAAHTLSQPFLDIRWITKVSRRGVTVMNSPVDGSKYNALRAHMRIQATAERILELLTDDTRLGEYDDMFDHITFLRNVPEWAKDGTEEDGQGGNDIEMSVDAFEKHGRTRRVCCKGLWPTAARDFVVTTTTRHLEDGALLVCSHTPEDQASLCPESKGYTRGCMNVSGYLLKPVDPSAVDGSHTECDVTLITHIDIGGTIPTSILNTLSTSAPIKLLTTVANIVV